MADRPYGVLRVGDVIGVVRKGSPFAALTRVVTGKNRWKDIRNYAVWTHVGITVEWEGQFFLAQMEGRFLRRKPGLCIDSFETLFKKRGARIAPDGIRRLAVYDDPDSRRALNKRVALMYRYQVDYDYKGLLEFVSGRVKDNPKRLICSEFVYVVTKPEVGTGQPWGYPTVFEEMVSPADLQVCRTLVRNQVDWR